MTDLYTLYNKNNDVIYVGVSSYAGRRLKEHQASAAWFDEVVKSEIESFIDRKAAIAKEADLIKTLKPKYNIKLNSETPKVETKTFSIRLNPDLLAWIEKQAKKENRSVNNWIETQLLKLKNKGE